MLAGYEINLTPIGIVRNSVNEAKHQDWQAVASEIVINDELEAALDGVEGFSHLIVVYWMHRLTSQKEPTIKVHPKGDQSLPLTGVFATRSPTRPNPIGVTVVRLIRRHKNILEVRGLDALNGTPVLDIKPYIPPHDSVDNATIPHWLR